MESSESWTQTLLQHLDSFRNVVADKFPNVRLSTILTWSLGCAMLTAMTFKDFFPLLAEYTHNNEATNVQVVLIEDAFEPPKMVLCIPFYKDDNKEHEDLMLIARHLYNGSELQCELCQRLKNVSWDVWNSGNVKQYAEHGIAAVYNALSLEFMQKLFITIDPDKEDVFHHESSSWNKPIFSAALNFFMWLEQSDYYYKLDNLGPGLVDSLHSFQTRDSSLKMDLVHSRVLNKLCQKILFAEILSKTEFRREATINTTCHDLLLHSPLPVTMDVTTGLWFALPAQDLPKPKEYRFTFLRTDLHYNMLWHTKSGAGQKPLFLYPDTSILYGTVIDPLYSSYIYKVPVNRKNGGHNIIVRYSVQMRAKETRSSNRKAACHNEDSVSCFTKCTKSWVIEKCACVPFNLKKGQVYDRSLPLCDFVTYSACNLTSLPTDQREYCLKKCNSACEYTSYNWQISYDNYDSGENVTEYRLQMLPMFNAFAEFRWTLKSTPEQFLSQLGGLVNLYLGLSGLSVFAFIIACIDFIKRLKKRQEVTDGAERREQQSSEWRWTSPARNNIFAFDGNNVREEKWATEVAKLKSEHRSEIDALKEQFKKEMRALEERLKRRR